MGSTASQFFVFFFDIMNFPPIEQAPHLPCRIERDNLYTKSTYVVPHLIRSKGLPRRATVVKHSRTISVD